MSADINAISSSLPVQRTTRDTQSFPVNRADSTESRAKLTSEPDQQELRLSQRTLTRDTERAPLVDESNRLADQLRADQEKLVQLQTQRDQLLKDAQKDTGETPQEALQRIRAAALEARFGSGAEDAGPLLTDSYFVTDNPVARLDSAISALERQAALTESRISEITEEFNAGQSTQLSAGQEHIITPEQAQETAQTAASEIQAQTIVSISTITAEDGTDVLAILEV